MATPLDEYGRRRPGSVLVSDRRGRHYWARIGDNLTLEQGELSAEDSGGGAVCDLLTCIDAGTGDVAFVFTSDGDYICVE
jgi:hypothetical protein